MALEHLIFDSVNLAHASQKIMPSSTLPHPKSRRQTVEDEMVSLKSAPPTSMQMGFAPFEALTTLCGTDKQPQTPRFYSSASTVNHF